MGLVLEKAREEAAEEADSRLANLIKQYGTREHAVQLVQDGCKLIMRYASNKREFERCRKFEGLMCRVLSMEEPSGKFCSDFDAEKRYGKHKKNKEKK
jgi:hypothetical protein